MNFWAELGFILYFINGILAIVASALIIYKRDDPVKTLSWVIVILAIPYFGLIAYMFLGRNFRKEKMFNRKGLGDSSFRKKRMTRTDVDAFLEGTSSDPILKSCLKIILQNFNSSRSLLLSAQDVKIYFSGKESIAAMMDEMEKAVNHIHLQSYILEADRVGEAIKKLLIRKAQEGVEVRLMFDGFGSRHLRRNYLSELEEVGVEILNFSPFRLLFPPPVVNYRNHRKILVVDGNVGFLGGVNLADRYWNGGTFPEWRDTHIRIEGEAVHALQESFLLDRFFIKNKKLKRKKKYYPELNLDDPSLSDSKPVYRIQTIASGPDSDWSGIQQCFLSAITHAHHRIYIITPYFVPTNSILDAIKNAALSGVDVNLMIPSKSDTWLTYWGTLSYISELLFAGVKIYLFEDGFNHSKVMSIDSEFCIIGSANMDNRSMEHNFEVTSVIYNADCAKTVEMQFQKDKHRCHLVTRSQWKTRSFRNRILEATARLISPLL